MTTEKSLPEIGSWWWLFPDSGMGRGPAKLLSQVVGKGGAVDKYWVVGAEGVPVLTDADRLYCPCTYHQMFRAMVDSAWLQQEIAQLVRLNRELKSHKSTCAILSEQYEELLEYSTSFLYSAGEQADSVVDKDGWTHFCWCGALKQHGLEGRDVNCSSWCIEMANLFCQMPVDLEEELAWDVEQENKVFVD